MAFSNKSVCEVCVICVKSDLGATSGRVANGFRIVRLISSSQIVISRFMRNVFQIIKNHYVQKITPTKSYYFAT